MKILSLIGVFAFLYPLALAARILVFKTNGGVWSFILGLVFILGGFLTGGAVIREDSKLLRKVIENPLVDFAFFLFNKRASVKAVSIMLAYATLIFPLTLSFALNHESGIGRAMFEAATALALYFLGLRGNFYEYDEILSPRKAYVGGVLILAVLIASFYIKNLDFMKTSGLLAGYLFILIFLIIRNQGNLDYNIFLKKYINISDGALKRIRIFNITVVSLLFIIILALFNFKNIVLSVFGLAGALLKSIVRLVFYLLSLIMPKGNMEEKFDTGQQPQLIPPESETVGSLLLEIIFRVIVIIVLIYFIYKTIPFAVEKIKTLFSYLGKLLKFLFTVNEAKEDISARDFEDEVEIVKFKKEYAGKRGRNRRGNWAQMDFNKIADPSLKIRCIYKTAVRNLIKENIPVAVSDTTREILAKSMTIKGLSTHLGMLTAIYERVRYGLKVPRSDEIDDAGEKLKLVTAVLLEKNRLRQN